MKMIGTAKKPEMRTVTQHTIFVPTADSCFSKGVQIFLYLSMAIDPERKLIQES
jgi:Tfp pilus assembly protein PilZ